MVTITITGPQGSGKTILAREIAWLVFGNPHADFTETQNGEELTVKKRLPYRVKATEVVIRTVQS